MSSLLRHDDDAGTGELHLGGEYECHGRASKSTGLAADRLAASWFASNSFEIDLNFTDGNAHRIALYALDWQDGSRSQTIELIDTLSGTVIDTRSISNFGNGVYLVWNVSGRITIKVTKNTGANAVISGLFFG